MTIFVLLPLSFFVFIFLILRNNGENGIRHAILSTSIIYGVSLTFITELFSIFRLITRGWISAAWASAFIIAGYVFIKYNKKARHPLNVTRIPRFLILLICLIAFIVAAVGLIALVAPPNTWDSMTYHMPRVMHWIQDHSVAHYPTSMTHQLFMPPWAEFAIMHFQILTDGDRLANCVQWFSMIGCIIGVSLIAKQLGAGLRGQIFASVIAASIPMGILQGSSTQNDYVVSFWLVCFVYFALRIKKTRTGLADFLQTGISLGLAILTKLTACFYALPFFFLLFWFLLKRFKSKSWKPLVLIIAIALVINMGHFSRNAALSRSLAYGTAAKQRVVNEIYGFQFLTSNIIRNAGLHLVMPAKRVRDKMNMAIKSLHGMLGIDMNDPRITLPQPVKYTGITRISFGEDNTGNPVHLALILLTLVFLMTSRSLKPKADGVAYAVVNLAAFVLICFTVKFDPYQGRYHLPLFVLMSALAGTVLAEISYKRIMNLIILICVFYSVPWVFRGNPRPLIGEKNIFNMPRIEQYFRTRIWLKDYYVEMASFVKSRHYSEIGLLAAKPWEYPLWVVLEEDHMQKIRIEYVGVDNISAKLCDTYPFKDFDPQAIVSFYDETAFEDKKIFNKNISYIQQWSSGPLKVFIRDRSQFPEK
ncbi:MAG: hypothetical protein A2Z72_01445 [Omnitrophica bacterium RBG_13_46_9]|nr:MAG: hypothetical protein A2Z72_01445 [Omnitrophica bacterium RBG_13_46_9]